MKISAIILFVMLSCTSNTLFAQTSKVNPCPAGFCVVNPSFVIDVFNFHKPRTGCERGFGLCIRGHWDYDCVPFGTPGATNCNFGSKYSQFLKVENGKVYAGFVIFDGKLELHIPKALAAAERFKNQDMTKFYIDDNAIELKSKSGISMGFLKGGEYVPVMSDADIVVTIPII